MNLTNKSGSLYATEGFTILVIEANSYYIEYSTSSGTKRGYVSKTSVINELDETCVGRMTSATTVYYDKSSTTAITAGSLSSGEYVAVLADDGSWTYVEYNTTGGRKRGYIPRSTVNIFEANEGTLWSIYKWPGYSKEAYTVSASLGQVSVYRVPNTLYARSGYVENEKIYILSDQVETNGQKYWFIQYQVKENNVTKTKTGYIKALS